MKTTKHCAQCATPFESAQPKAIYCSRKCNHNAWLSRGNTYKPKPRAMPRYMGRCGHCQSTITGIGHAKQFCGDPCRKAFDKASRDSARALTPLTCVQCGSPFTAEKSLVQSLCSDACRKAQRKACRDAYKQTPAHKAHKRVHRSARKARERAAVVERFDPLDILRRDAWVCQECGIETPPHKRGTYDDDAPEVDHIMPLARGGSHSRDNCQCLCRKCNIAKGDGLPGGDWADEIVKFQDRRAPHSRIFSPLAGESA